MPEPAEALARLLRPARRVLVFTGAGLSTASGIPDFRGPQGVWKRRSPVYFHDFLASEAARVEYWDQKSEGEEAFRRARPTPAHEAVTRLEAAGRVIAVVTQNIDGLHAKAGTAAERLVELHGTNAVVRCLGCSERTDPAAHFKRFRETRAAPRCACGGLLKPDTISFGQDLRPADLARAAAAAAACDFALALGSTLSVHPAAGFPLEAALRGAPYAIVNRGPTDQDGHACVTLRIEGDVQAIVPEAVARALAG